MDDLVGKTVRLAKVHPLHCPGLKANLGRSGRVDVDRVPYTGGVRECLVYFEGSSVAVINRWWVRPSYLEVVGDQDE